MTPSSQLAQRNSTLCRLRRSRLALATATAHKDRHAKIRRNLSEHPKVRKMLGLRTDHLNFRSQRAIEALGAKKDGVIRHHAPRRDGTIRDTVIGSGTKLDNLVQIAHNVEVGEHTVLAAQTGIAGSTKVGAYSQFGGQVGVAGHLTIGDSPQQNPSRDSAWRPYSYPHP